MLELLLPKSSTDLLSTRALRVLGFDSLEQEEHEAQA